MAKKLSKSGRGKKKKTSNKAATKKRSKKTVAKRLPAKSPTTKRRKASGKSKRISKTPKKRGKRTPLRKTAWEISPQEAVYIAVLEKNGVVIDLYLPFVDAFIIVAKKPGFRKQEKLIAIDKFNYIHCEPGDADGLPRWTFPEKFPSEEQEKIKSLSSKEYHSAMIEAGWTCYDTTLFWGPLSVKKIEFEYPYNPV
jgi:hypothetical protein